jgi:hypothetical protein
MTRKSFGTTLFVAGLNSIIIMIIGVYFVVIPNIIIYISSDVFRWIMVGPLSMPINIIGAISGVAAFILVILYLIFGYQYAKQSHNPTLMQFWNKILVGSILQLGLTVLSVLIGFLVHPGTLDIGTYMIIIQIQSIVNEIITIISLAFLIRGWSYYIQYAQNHESPNSVNNSRFIKKGYQISQIISIATIILTVLVFLVIFIQSIFSLYFPLLGEIFTILYMIVRSIIDIGAVIVGPIFILIGQIKLGKELMSNSPSLTTEPVLNDPHLYGQPQNRKYCKYCGASMLIEAKFCPHCGQST